MAEFLCFGEALIVFSPSGMPSLEAAQFFHSSVAGAECNVALALAALGHAVDWAGRLGADPFGDRVIGMLDAAGVGTAQVRREKDGFTGIYFKPGDGGRVRYYRHGSAAGRLGVEDLDRMAMAGPVKVVHLTGITSQLSPSARAAVWHAVQSRPFGEAVVSFDVNHRPALAGSDTPAELLALASQSDAVFVGLDEAGVLWGTPTAEAVRTLLPGPRWLIVKDGDREAVEFDGGHVTRVPAPAVEVVDATGAGDAFAAGWLSGLRRGLPARDRLETGHACAGQVLRSRADAIVTEGSLNALI